MAKEIKRTPTTFLSIDRDGRLYTRSKEPKEGYEKYIHKDKDGNKTGESYRKYFYSTDDGKVSFLGIIEIDLKQGGKLEMLKIAITNENGRDVLSIPLRNNFGGVTQEAKVLINLLPNIDYSRPISISTGVSDNEYKNLSIFIKYADTNGKKKEYVKWAHKWGKNGDIPPPVKKVKLGKETWNFDDQDEFFYDILTQEIKRFQAHKDKEKPVGNDEYETAVPTENHEQPVSSPTTPVEETYDDLPF